MSSLKILEHYSFWYKIKTWLYPAESYSKNVLLTKDKVQITPSSFNLTPIKPFKNLYDIPDIPHVDKKTYNEIIIPNLVRCGAIPKKDLIIGKTYIGECRNASEAVWNGHTVVYKRYKFGDIFDEEINHFEDDDGYDLFVPIKLKE